MDMSILEGLSDEEKRYALKILGELSEKGTSDTYDKLLLEDWKEPPVDIYTFITDDEYLGQAWKLADGKLALYPFWIEQLKKLFPDAYTTSVNNFIESGARGLGKSEIAVTSILYLMYRVMCLKDPLAYFGLKNTEKICFALLNITKDLAEEIAISKFQKTVQKSPWFMRQGRMTSYQSQPYWIPPEPIAMIIGSQPSHVIGMPIYACLDGDTEVVTLQGNYKIRDLVDKKVNVLSVSNNGELEYSEFCTAKATNLSLKEYCIELEDGTILKCTSEHRFMLKTGQYKMAKDLTDQDELLDFI